MQKTLPMHLNMSPTSFEGSGTGKQEKIHKPLKKLKTLFHMRVSFLQYPKPNHKIHQGCNTRLGAGEAADAAKT